MEQYGIAGIVAVSLLGAFALLTVAWIVAGFFPKRRKWYRFHLAVWDYMDGCAARGLTGLGGDWEATKRKMQEKEGRKFGDDGKPLDDIGWR